MRTDFNNKIDNRKMLGLILFVCGVLGWAFHVVDHAEVKHLQTAELGYIRHTIAAKEKLNTLCEANRQQEAILRIEFPHVKMSWTADVSSICGK